jgi:hypothetical protein
MASNTTVVLSGGIGKCVAFTAAIPKMVKKYGPITIMSPWPDLFTDLEGVYRSISFGVEYGYEYFQGKNRLSPEPYNRNDFFQKKIHLIDGFMKECGLEENYDSLTDLPLAPSFLDINSKNKIDAIRQNGKYIVVQFMGGNQAQNGKMNDKFMAKDYPPQLIENLIIAIGKKYGSKIQIVNYGLPFEFNIANTISAADLPYTAAAYLLKNSETFIAIDSNLQHFSACKGVEKKGIVLWAATDPINFGYPHNINLSAECPYNDLHCNRPYFQHTSDIVGKGIPWSCKTKDCLNISPEKVLSELEKII